jgi:hypothetical protein
MSSSSTNNYPTSCFNQRRGAQERDHGPTTRHSEPGFLFAGRELLESHTTYLEYSCPVCGQRVRRTKRPIDASRGIKLYVVSCHCVSKLCTGLCGSQPKRSGRAWWQKKRSEGQRPRALIWSNAFPGKPAAIFQSIRSWKSAHRQRLCANRSESAAKA